MEFPHNFIMCLCDDDKWSNHTEDIANITEVFYNRIFQTKFQCGSIVRVIKIYSASELEILKNCSWIRYIVPSVEVV